jgi:RNA polymerase sigma-54 factor
LTLWWLTDDEIAVWQELAASKGLATETFYANAPRAIASQYGTAEDEVWQAIRCVQSLDPQGVASRDLRACLLTQARSRFPDHTALHRLCDAHLQRLADHDYVPIRRDLRCGPDDLAALVKLLGSLEPRPGRHFSGETARYITPDVFVTKVGEDYVVTLNEDGLPKLRVSNFYKHALSDDVQGDAALEQARTYLQEKLRAATWMIRSIHQRQSTIQRVTESIMRLQRPFLDGGPERLRPLVLRDVAEDVGLHESTVSRVTTSKYVHTPQGIYELKYFFGSRIAAQGGEDVAAQAVKLAIKKLIEREPPSAPLSDQEIAEMLQGEWDRGRMLARLVATETQLESLRPSAPMSIARRTVAKYREQLGIESSSRRRKGY